MMNKISMQDLLKTVRSFAPACRAKMKDLMARVEEQLGREKSVIGIDVGASSVKAVQMADVGGKWTVVKSALVDIGGTPGNQEEALASLRTALLGMDTQGARVTAVVNCPETCTRKVIAPYMSRKELGQAVRWEAKNTIPFSVDEALMDYKILGEVSDKNVRKLLVSVAAAPKRTVNKLVTLLSKAGLKISALIPVSLSLQNLIRLDEGLRQGIIAVVEMGDFLTELNIYRDGESAFSRKLPVSGKDITKALTTTLMSSQGKVELSVPEAEKVKKDQGISSGEGTELIDGKILPVQILSLVRPCVEQLADEIERSFDFFREESHGGAVRKILLTGGGANLKGLVQALKNELAVDIEAGNFLGLVPAAPKAVVEVQNPGRRLHLAIGAALNRKDTINLLPVELKEKTKRFIENVSFKGVMAGAAGALLLFYIGLHVQLRGYHKKIAALKLERQTEASQIRSLKAKILAVGLLKDSPYWEDVLKEISHLTPPDIYLTSLETDDDEVSLQGTIRRSGENAQAVLSRFMLKLEEGIFKNVSLVNVQATSGGAGAAEFEITCTVE